MKTSFLMLALFSLSAHAADAALKVAYVDLQKALQTVDAGKTAKAQLEKDVAAKRHPDSIEFSDGNFYRKFYIPLSECKKVK